MVDDGCEAPEPKAVAVATAVQGSGGLGGPAPGRPALYVGGQVGGRAGSDFFGVSPAPWPRRGGRSSFRRASSFVVPRPTAPALPGRVEHPSQEQHAAGLILANHK